MFSTTYCFNILDYTDMLNIRYLLLLYTITVIYIYLMSILINSFSETKFQQHFSVIHSSFALTDLHWARQRPVNLHSLENNKGVPVSLDSNRTSDDNPQLVLQIQKQFLQLPSSLSYNLSHPEVQDHSGGHQGAIVDYLFRNKVSTEIYTYMTPGR